MSDRKYRKSPGYGGLRSGAGAPGKERLITRRDRLGRRLSKKSISTRYPEDVHTVLEKMESDDRQRLIREAVEALLITLGKLKPPQLEAPFKEDDKTKDENSE